MTTDYDVIIIGAGIGGLVCGCYLAKAGIRTLIIEKNANPGGYCTSFIRNGFTFDACAHALGSLRKGGSIATVLKELNIDKRIDIRRHDPSDIIQTPDCKINFWNNLNKTIQEFQRIFQSEKNNIQDFFNYLTGSRGVSSVNLANKTFEDLLRQYFRDSKLRAILSLPVLGYAGLPSSLISAFTAYKLYQEFILDGGYYPSNGMQAFPDILAIRFKELGGTLLLSKSVTQIKINKNEAKGIILRGMDAISAKYIISNCDTKQTFSNLITEKCENNEKIDNLLSSDSMFIAYLGINKDSLALPPENNSYIWFMPHYDIERMYEEARERTAENISWYFVHVHPNRKSLSVLISAAFKNKDYWSLNKIKILDSIINKAESIIPNLSKYVVFKDAATPNTLYKWTLNYKGAAYGWASTPSQLARPGLSQTTPIKNLYLTGHWTTLAQGIPGVSYLGRDTAKIILRRENKDV